ncbi:chorismate mutase [Clostridium sp.]|uniref:chorismate mutase n=1 Tax=Clostridium sp. TaxID=1506 RepID=UPI002FC75439
MISIRGATTLNANSLDEIRNKTIELISEIINTNQLNIDDINTMIFSCTEDITAAYPGAFVREYFEMNNISIMHFNEMKVENSIKLCVRVLILSNEEKSLVKFVYLHKAKELRKDLNK